MTHVTCRLTAKNRNQLLNPTVGNRVWATFFTFLVACSNQSYYDAAFLVRGNLQSNSFYPIITVAVSQADMSLAFIISFQPRQWPISTRLATLLEQLQLEQWIGCANVRSSELGGRYHQINQVPRLFGKLAVGRCRPECRRPQQCRKFVASWSLFLVDSDMIFSRPRS